MASAPLLQLSGVTKSYGEAVVTEVLHGLDLVLERGELAALVGPSGSGKSTLLNLLGLLDRPTTGRIEVLGQDIAALSDEVLTRFRGQTLGFIFQFHHLLPAFTALENVCLPLIADRGREEGWMVARGRELLDQVGLSEKANQWVGKLSGGQQQRVAVARALVMEPALVLADEPTGNLDTVTGDQVFDLLKTLNRARGIAFLVVTHDGRLAQRCDRIIELVDGRIVSDLCNQRLIP